MSRRVLATVVPLSVALSALVTLVAPAAPTVHAAEDGLDFRNTTTYTLDPAAAVVHVRADLVLTNTLPDKVQGNIINRRYFRGFSLPAPSDAAAMRATDSNGRSLSVVRRPIDSTSNFVIFDIDFAKNLFYRQTARVTVTYDITGLPPRSENPSRVNAAYAAFDAFGVGDDGKVTVKVIVPQGFVVDALGSDAQVSYDGGRTIYTATNIPNPDQFDVFVSARNDKALTSTPVKTADGDEFDLRTWPGDTEWQEFVTTQIQKGVPALSDLVGRPWPIPGKKVEVRQAYTPYLYGYAGWFSAVDDELEIGEDLDQEVVLHELSHAWFSDDWFDDRWVNEGLAQVYSNMAVKQLGGTPKQPEPIKAADPGKVTLNEWGNPNFTDGADEVETYGYNASYSVMQRIHDEIGDDKMRSVFAIVDDGIIAYTGADLKEKGDSNADWRRLLDILEITGDSKDARDLFEQYVVSAKDLAKLDDRDAARTLYADVAERGGEWAPPLVVRRNMAGWIFDNATTTMSDATDVLDLRDELDDKSAQLDATYPTNFETDYEAVTRSFDEVADEMQQQIDTADAVIAATATEAKDDGFFESIGLWGTTLPKDLEVATAAFEKGDHDTARAAAEKVTDTLAEAGSVGTKRFLWALGGLPLFVLLIVLVVLLVRRRRRRRRQAAADAEAAAVAEASETAEERAAPDESGGVDAAELDENALPGAGERSVDD